MRRLAFLTSALLTCAALPHPVAADTGSTQGNTYVQSFLKDDVFEGGGINAQTQGAGVPNSFGVTLFKPLEVEDRSLVFFDAAGNVNLGDHADNSSIVNTDVEGVSLSGSSKLGMRWLNDTQTWMYGIHGGFDYRQMNTGSSDTTKVKKQRDVSYYQVALGLEAISNDWEWNPYILYPVGDTERKLNNKFEGGALGTYGFDVRYNFTPEFKSTLGYYYQQGDLDAADGSGMKGQLAYHFDNGLSVGTNVSYDDAFYTRISATFNYRFRFDGQQKNKRTNLIKALSASPANRDIRVHDLLL